MHQAPDHWLTPEQLKAVRLGAALNQQEMADALDYSYAHYNQMELGHRRIPTTLSLCVKRRVVRYLRTQQERIETCITNLS